MQATLNVPVRIEHRDGRARLLVVIAGVEYSFYLSAKMARDMTENGVPQSINLGRPRGRG